MGYFLEIAYVYVTDAIIINGPDGMIIGLGSKGLSWKELLSYIYM